MAQLSWLSTDTLAASLKILGRGEVRRRLVDHLTITSHWLHTSFHLGPLAGSRTRTPGHSGQPLTPREFSPWVQVGWEQEEQEEPEVIPGKGGLL